MRGFLSGAFWSGFYRISAIGIAFFISVISARLLGVGGYGTLQFVLSFTQLAQLGLGLGMATLVLRASGEEATRADLVSLDVLIKRAIAVFFVLLILSATPGVVIWGWVEGSAPISLLVAAAAFASTQHLISVYRSALVGKSRFIAAGFGEFFAGLCAFILLGGILIFCPTQMSDPTIVLAVRTGAAALGSLFLYLAWTQKRKSASANRMPVFELSSVMNMAKSGFPIMLVGAGAILNSSADILFLGLIRSGTEVGQYHVATRGATLVLLPLTVIIVPLSPLISKLQKKRLRELKVVYLKSTAIVAAAAVCIAGLLFVFLDRFLSLFGSGFQEAACVTIVLAAVQVVNACFGPLQHLLVMTGNQTLAYRAMLAGVSANIFANLLLIPQYGTIGAAIGTGIGIIVWNAMSMKAVWAKVFQEVDAENGTGGRA